jgi:polysaccharide export outer membrane protein
MMHRTAPLALVATLLVASACLTPIPPGATRPYTEPEYRVAPPDQLSITVRPAPEIQRELTVRPDGNISMDLIGDLRVQGKTVAEIRDDVEKRMKEFVVQPDVTVTLISSNSRRVHVLGEVNAPGAYPINGEMRVVDAISGAGGPTRLASDAIRLVRPGEEGGVYGVDFDGITQLADAGTNYVLQPGDVIYVPPTVSARIGYAIQVIFYPIQAIIGLGGPLI